MTLRSVVAVSLAALGLAACGGGKSSAPPAAAASQAAAPAALTAENAPEVVSAFLAAHPAAPPPPELAKPSSTDNVLEILKRDQLDLFPVGAAYIATVDSPEAKALHAQLELAWSEACTMAAEALGEEAERLRMRAETAKGRGGDTAALDTKFRDFSRTSEALLLVADQHLARGKDLAEKVMAAAPDSYLGYRVAADYYRLLHKWPEFADMVAKIEATNPDSNGLVFLKAAAAAQRDFDFRSASELYRKALENDPQFTRAQMALMLGQENLGELWAEFQKLQALNPNHHLVRWAADAIRADYEEWKAEHEGGAAAEAATE